VEIIERYVHEVGRHLPRRLRAEVQIELRSLLTTAVEERRGEGVPEELARELLRQLGAPEDVAARYVPPTQALVGPRLFPAFKIVCGWTAGGISLVFGLQLAGGGFREFLTASGFGTMVADYLRLLFLSLGVVVLVFAVLERVLPTGTRRPRPWDPKALPPVRDPDALSRTGAIARLGGTLLLMVLFNVFPQWVAVYPSSQAGGPFRVPLLRPEFGAHMPLLNLWWIGALVLNLLLLRHGRWRPATRVLDAALVLAGAGVVWTIISGPEVFLADRTVKALLQLALLAMVVDFAMRIFRLVSRWGASDAGPGEGEAGGRGAGQ
jgi:hypothetical protein